MSGGQDKIKIRAFGCSHTAQHHWLWLNDQCEETSFRNDLEDDWRLAKEIGINAVNNFNPCEWSSDDIHMESYAMSGAGLDSQIAIWSNLMLTDKIDADDLVIFQITNPGRVTIPINQQSSHFYGNELARAYKKDEVKDWGCFQVIEDEHFTEKKIYGFDPSCTGMFDISKKTLSQTRNIYSLHGKGAEPDPYRLHVILSTLSAIKSFNNKLLILFGWEDAFNFDPSVLPKLKQALSKVNIDYIDTGILDYSVNSGHGVAPDGHSTQAGYYAFTNKILKTKLKELGWLS